VTPGPARRRRRLVRAWHDEHGFATNVMVILLVPLTLGLVLIGVQTVLWQHARTVTSDRANQTAALVAAGELGAAEGDAQLTASLTDLDDLANVDVDIAATDELITVTVAGDARGILVGTRTRIRLTTTTPVEGWRPLP
jgi:hypothetical protein